MSEKRTEDFTSVSRKHMMKRVWVEIVEAFAIGDIDRARSLERFLSALEDLETGRASWADGTGSLS